MIIKFKRKIYVSKRAHVCRLLNSTLKKSSRGKQLRVVDFSKSLKPCILKLVELHFNYDHKLDSMKVDDPLAFSRKIARSIYKIISYII